jgi:hypothetical protein
MASEGSLRAMVHVLCLGRDPPCGCLFCQNEEDPEFGDLADAVDEAERVLAVLGPSLSFGPPMRRGDLVRVGGPRNDDDRVFLCDGHRLVELGVGDGGYARIPDAVSMTEFGTAHYYELTALDIWGPVPVDFADYEVTRSQPIGPRYAQYRLYVYRHKTTRSDVWFVAGSDKETGENGSEEGRYWVSLDPALGWLGREPVGEKILFHRMLYADVGIRWVLEDSRDI